MGLPSSVRRTTSPTDEDASLPLLGGEEIGVYADDDAPIQFGAARLGIP